MSVELPRDLLICNGLSGRIFAGFLSVLIGEGCLSWFGAEIAGSWLGAVPEGIWANPASPRADSLDEGRTSLAGFRQDSQLKNLRESSSLTLSFKLPLIYEPYLPTYLPYHTIPYLPTDIEAGTQSSSC